MKPHIIIFNPDQFRADGLGHIADNSTVTPFLDTLVAEEAVSFSQNFCQNPVCTPSRCSFMTGLYPHVHGHRTMDHMVHAEHGEQHMLRILKQQGYHIWWGGKNDLVPGQNGFDDSCHIRFSPTEEDYSRWNAERRPSLHGWTDWRGKKGEASYYGFLAGKLPLDADGKWFDSDWAFVHGAVDHIKNYDRDEPMVLYLPLLYPHPPYGVEEPFYSQNEPKDLPERIQTLHDNEMGKKPKILHELITNQNLQGWDDTTFDELRKIYYAMCSRIDHQVSMIVDALQKKGMWDDSLFLFFSDHGDFTGDYGLVEKNQNTFEDVLTRVPLVVKPPKGSQGKGMRGVVSTLTELVDIPATVYDYCEITPDYWHFGKSLRPVIEAKTAIHRQEVHCEGGRLPGETYANEHSHFMNFDDPQESLYYPRIALQLLEDPFLHGKATMLRTAQYKYVRRMQEEDEFYDLSTDPTESLNRINDPACSRQIIEMKERMLDWYQQTADTIPYQFDDRE